MVDKLAEKVEDCDGLSAKSGSLSINCLRTIGTAKAVRYTE